MCADWRACYTRVDQNAMQRPIQRVRAYRRKDNVMLMRRTALVTGAAHGIGYASAIKLADQGCDIAASDIDSAGLAELGREITSQGRRFVAIEADMGDLAEIDRTVQATVGELGRIDILVNNAGVTRPAHIMELEEADWDRMMRVNGKGVFFMMQRCAREMIKQGGGRIINMGSIAGKGFAGASNVIYAGSKGAVISMTRLAALQLGEHNITVNAVCPGITATAIFKGIVERNAAKSRISYEEMYERAVAKVPLKRANEPEDVAAMVVYLASDGARNVTGQTINIDGGLIPD